MTKEDTPSTDGNVQIVMSQETLDMILNRFPGLATFPIPHHEHELPTYGLNPQSHPKGILNRITKLFRPGTPEPASATGKTPAKKQRITEDLQNTLIDLVHHELLADMQRRLAADPNDQRAKGNMDLGLALTTNKIKALERDTMVAMLGAAKHPRYRIANALRRDSGMADDETQVRDVALFFDILRASKMQPANYGTALHRLRSITKEDNLFLLTTNAPQYPRAVLQLVLHFTTKSKGPLNTWTPPC